MKKLLLGAVALVALGLGGAPANAADMPVYRKAEPLPVWTWAGVYFGAHAGGARGDSHWVTNDNLTAGVRVLDTVDQKPGGYVVGGQGGARWQWGAWVVGLEGTIAVTDIRANDPACGVGVGVLNCPGPITVAPGFTQTRDTRILNAYSATAQLGYAFNRSLWYVKGGWAGAQVRLQNDSVRAGVAAEATTGFCVTAGAGFSCAGLSRQAAGWTVGTGIEYLVLQNLSLGIEYDYFRFHIGDTVGTRITPLTLAGAPVQTNFNEFRADVHQIVARANYRLDWGILWGEPPAPVAARN